MKNKINFNNEIIVNKISIFYTHNTQDSCKTNIIYMNFSII